MAELNKELFKGKTPENLNQKIQQIMGYYNQSIKVYPEYYSSYNNIGTIYFTVLASASKNSGDSVKAREYYKTGILYFKKAISMNPEYTEAFFNMAYSYEMIGEYDSAMINYRKNLNLKPDNVRSLSNLANIYFNKFNNYDSALAINNRIMEINPETDIPYVNFGTYALKRSDTLAAVGFYETALEKFPQNYDLASKLSRYYQNKDQEKYQKYNKMAADAKKILMTKE